jgi:hypothetical protein
MNYTNFRIFNTNYADPDILANYDVSSEQTSFPVENMLNWQRRSKVWRSNGYWRVTDSNKTLLFKEASASTLTATLNTGEYNATTLAADIKRAMEVSGDSTYTVTYSNMKFNFSSNGTGGDGIFTIVYSGSTLATDIGLQQDKTGALSYNMDKTRIHGIDGEWVIFDLGVSTNPDAILMIDQKQSAIKISPTATIKLQANTTSNFDNPQFEVAIPYDDEVLSYISDAGMATAPYRYWKILFNDPHNPNGYIQMGAVSLSNYMNPQRGRAVYPLTQGYIDKTETIFSESGASFSDIKYKTQGFDVSLFGLQIADIEEFDRFFNDYGVGYPFFVSMDTGEVWSSDYRRRVIFCKFDQSPKYKLSSPNNFTLDVSFREEL